eukprot:14146597-Heterocapsa_arctica.AAC.1
MADGRGNRAGSASRIGLQPANEDDEQPPEPAQRARRDMTSSHSPALGRPSSARPQGSRAGSRDPPRLCDAPDECIPDPLP